MVAQPNLEKDVLRPEKGPMTFLYTEEMDIKIQGVIQGLDLADDCQPLSLPKIARYAKNAAEGPK